MMVAQRSKSKRNQHSQKLAWSSAIQFIFYGSMAVGEKSQGRKIIARGRQSHGSWCAKFKQISRKAAAKLTMDKPRLYQLFCNVNPWMKFTKFMFMKRKATQCADKTPPLRKWRLGSSVDQKIYRRWVGRHQWRHVKIVSRRYTCLEDFFWDTLRG